MKNKSSKSKNTIDNLSDKYINAVSSTDCTGLMPSDPKSNSEVESYKEIYNFEVPVAEDLDRNNKTSNNKK
jgi:hypothetical protein